MTDLASSSNHSLGYKMAYKKRFLSQFEQQQNYQGLCCSSSQNCFPKFFRDLLLSGKYKEKKFENRIHSYEQVFTYVYLFTCFQQKNTIKQSEFLEYIIQLIQKIQFQFLLPQKYSELCEYTHADLKSLMSQYLNLMNSKTISVIKSLNKYPFVIEIFTAFFRTLLYLGQISTQYNQLLQIQSTFQFLTSYFDLQMTIGENFLFFPQSGIYVYQKNIYETHMFYPTFLQDSHNSERAKQFQILKSEVGSINYLMSSIDKKSENSNQSSKNSKSIKRKNIKLFSQSIKEAKKVNILKEDESLKKTLDQKVEESQWSKISYNYTQSESNTFQLNKVFREKDFNQRKMKKDNQRLKNSLFFQQYKVIEEESKVLKSEKKISNHQKHKSQLAKLFESNKQNNSLFYSENPFTKNKKTQKTLFMQSQVSSSSNRQRKQLQQNVQNMEECNAFYRPYLNIKNSLLQQPSKNIVPWINKNITRQFTSSFILNQMPQPYKTNIRLKKQKAREQRRKAYNLLI